MYLYVGQLLSKDRTAAALSELFGVPVCGASVLNMTRRAATRLEGFLGRATEQIAAAPLAHFDETGLRVAGALHWVHSASTAAWSLITVHRRRGRQAMDTAGVLPGFGGVAAHDAWAPYDTYQDVDHALCNAHLLRELPAVIDTTAEGQWCWAAQAADALRQRKSLVDTAIAAGGFDRLDRVALDEQIHLWRSAAIIGKNDSAARTSGQETSRPGPPHARSARRLPAIHPRPPGPVR